MIHNSNEVLPISDDDAFIARALLAANIPTLMMSIIHLTGKSDLLDGDIRPKAGSFLNPANTSFGLTPAQEQRVRELALAALRDYRDRGCPTPAPLPVETVRRMMSFFVGEAVPDDYVPMLYQEMRLDESAIRPLSWRVPVSEEKRKNYRVLIIGAGMMGMVAAIKLDELGVPYMIIEKNDDVGGTWLENTYPGLRVDIPNHFYSYSFERNPDWSQNFSIRDELIAYFRKVADKFGIKKRIQFGSKVEEARWSEETSSWTLRVRRRNGAMEEMSANAVIAAVGQLSQPKLPDVPGRETFRGPWSHTSGFDRNMPIAGKRVAVVGSAATALQMVPEIAKSASKLYVFQRTAHWVLPIINYHNFVPDDMKWLLRHVPAYASWYRFSLFWMLTDGTRHWYVIDPKWPHQERSVNAINEDFRIQLTDFIEAQTAARPGLAQKVIPKYPPFADRILLDNGNYYRALTRDHVELVTTPLSAIDETGITDAEAKHYDVDAIIYATGFQMPALPAHAKIFGKGGESLEAYWNDFPRAYLGITMPHFPNFFMMWGPSTAGSTGGSMTSLGENQAHYIVNAIQQMIENGISSLECKEEVLDEYVDRYQKEMETLVFASPAIHSYFKNKAGKIWYNLCWRQVDYWKWTRAAALVDFHVTKRREHKRSTERTAT